MSTTEQKAAVEFAKKWQGRGDEKQETQRFWIELLQDVLGRRNALDETEFEHQTAKGGYIDVLCPNAKFLVEQKSLGISLDKAEQRQNSQVTPVEQALRYANYLPADQKPIVICTCNFERFRFYDLNADPAAAKPPIEEFTLDELPDHLSIFEQIFAPEHSRIVAQQKLSEKAGVLVANLHNALAAQYIDPDSSQSHHALAVLTVRIVFCLYAEDAGLFNPSGSFTSYVKTFEPIRLRTGILALFDVLNTAYDERDPYLDDQLKLFPYVNGGLFAEPIEVPQFSGEIQTAITDAGDSFDWKDISPVIFGSLMEETLSHDQRRAGGMHYTTVENIHRVIDPLFLDDLKAELSRIETEKVSEPTREKHLHAFQDEIAGLQFLDPACGSGNFLTETFLELRKLENRVLEHLLHRQGVIDFGEGTDAGSLVKVSIAQMHGIEINDFAVSVAKTALWIAQQQALDATESISGQALDHLPLHDAGNIVEANALRYDWNELLPGTRCNYVMGNPPFIGAYLMDSNQKEDMRTVWGKSYNGYLDYSTSWYRKASMYLANTPGSAFAFVSTNSIAEGQPVAALFETLFSEGWRISFAHQTFAWAAQSSDMAHVHVVIVGMDKSSDRIRPPQLFTYKRITDTPFKKQANHINGYLIDGPNIFTEKRMTPLSPLLNPAVYGSKPADGGGFSISLDEHPDGIARQYIRRFVGARELIDGSTRYCLWLKDTPLNELSASRTLKEHLTKTRDFRLASTKASTQKMSETPQLFAEDRQPTVPYLAIPSHFSRNRRYMTCRRFDADVVLGNACFLTEDLDGFAFAVIESSMFITWQKTIGGRLKSDYRFSNTVVWNNLPLPSVGDKLRQRIIEVGQYIEEVRDRYPEESLANLYNPLTMHPDLIKAHEALDRVVDKAFGAEKPCHSDEDRLTILFMDYVELTKLS
ncbi:class I SAM-dependent DNA methyltransferase [Bifidobacterium sp. ESL0690]|uniref:DNA methyltransferase n=1 Tax=Bifidobacterium sp. ESL0690 TaxID=2983214 RepID=UPI0023F902FE|nr:DNA methyltransferase [Bifidobacterium sp. ESL0690]WEV47280.1 class I SAM-dependent DNA methyltransferase [Bifidobacterium sp. ESL0690]